MHKIMAVSPQKTTVFSLFILLLTACCTTTLTMEEKGTAEDTSQPCPICKPGTGLQKYCGIGYHGGTDQSCEPCIKGETYNEREGSNRCLPCQNCDLYLRETIDKCHESRNSICGPCKTGYYSYQKYNRSIQSVLLESCLRCWSPEDQPDCFEHFTTMTVLSETKAEVKVLSVKERDDNRMARIEVGTFMTILFIAIVLLLVIVLVISTVRKRRQQTDKRDSKSETIAEKQTFLNAQNAGSDATVDNDNNKSKDDRDCRISMLDGTSENPSVEKNKCGFNEHFASCIRPRHPTELPKESQDEEEKRSIQKYKLQRSAYVKHKFGTKGEVFNLRFSGDRTEELEAVGGNSCPRYSIDRSCSPSTHRQPAPDSTGLQADGINLNPTFQSSNLEVNEIATDQSRNPEVNDNVNNGSPMLLSHSAKAPKKVDANTACDKCSSQPSSIPTNIINNNFHGNCQNVFNHGNSNTVHNAQNQGASCSPSTHRQPAPDSTGLQADGINLNPTFQSSNLEVNEIATDQSRNPEVTDNVNNGSPMLLPHSAKAPKKVDANTACDKCSSQPSSIPTNIINNNFHGNCQNVFNHGNSNTVHNAQNQGQFSLYDNNTNTRPTPPNCSSKQEDPADQDKFPEPESNVGPCEYNNLPGHISQPQPPMGGLCSRCHENACSCNDSTLTQTAQADVVSPQQACDIPVEETCTKKFKTELVSSVS